MCPNCDIPFSTDGLILHCIYCAAESSCNGFYKNTRKSEGTLAHHVHELPGDPKVIEVHIGLQRLAKDFYEVQQGCLRFVKNFKPNYGDIVRVEWLPK